MVENEGLPATSRRRHIVRLAVFAGFLVVMFYLVAVARVIDIDEVRRAISATGPAAPLVYVVVSAILGSLFVPGAILAAGSGILFGPVLGIFVTLGATVGTAIVASRVGSRAGRDSARAVLGTKRADRIEAMIDRRGLWAVVGQRFIPGTSDALASYAFGAIGVPLWQMVVGAFNRLGAAGIRLHRAGRLARETVVTVGLLGDRGLVRDRHRRRIRRAARIPEMARARSLGLRSGTGCVTSD